jgi:hypothetical protein
MAAQDSMIAGLFTTPEMYQQQQDQLATQQAIQMAQLAPEQRAQADIRGGFQRAGNAIGGLMGAQDPMMKMQALRTQIMQGVDQTDATSLKEAAKKLADMGDLQGASALAQRSVEVQSKIDEKQATRDTQLQIAREKIAAQIEAAKERGATQLQIAQMAQEGRMMLAQLAQGTKQAAADEKAAVADQQRVGAVASFNDALTTLDVLKNHAGKSAAVGFGGGAASMIPGTAAYGFGKQLETFKAQTFVPMVSALKGMGALSDAEGKKLTDSVGALDQGMSPKEFDTQVTAIEKKLQAAKKRAEAMVKDKTLLKPFETPSEIPAATPIYATNPTTKERIMSTDGGKTWTKAQ